VRQPQTNLDELSQSSNEAVRFGLLVRV
jgi:hypothetical protein